MRTEENRHRGHELHLEDDTWVYSDNNMPVSEWKNRPCGHCRLSNTPEGHDGCLGTLPGVMNACCGHGEARSAYVQFWDRQSIHGNFAQRIIDRLRATRRTDDEGDETD